MNESLIVEMLDELKEKACAFKLAFIDPAVQPEDLVMESMPKLLALPDCKTRTEMRKLALTTFYNVCRDMQRKAMRQHGAHVAPVAIDDLADMPSPFSYQNLLLRLGVQECLQTLSEQDRRLVQELVQPTAPVLAAARARHTGGALNIQLRDVARGHGISIATVGRAMHRARHALQASGIV